jgi:uncharacterized membrane protein YqjE
MEEEEKANYRYILIIGLVVVVALVGSLAVAYVLLWAWRTSGILFFPFLAAAVFGLLGLLSLWNFCKKRRAASTPP